MKISSEKAQDEHLSPDTLVWQVIFFFVQRTSSWSEAGLESSGHGMFREFEISLVKIIWTSFHIFLNLKDGGRDSARRPLWVSTEPNEELAIKMAALTFRDEFFVVEYLLIRCSLVVDSQKWDARRASGDIGRYSGRLMSFCHETHKHDNRCIIEHLPSFVLPTQE